MQSRLTAYWQTHPAVIAAANAEAQAVEERKQEIREEHDKAVKRQERAERMFHDLLEYGESIAEARQKTVARYPEWI